MWKAHPKKTPVGLDLTPDLYFLLLIRSGIMNHCKRSTIIFWSPNGKVWPFLLCILELENKKARNVLTFKCYFLYFGLTIWTTRQLYFESVTVRLQSLEKNSVSRINEPYAAVSQEKHFWKFWSFEEGNIISSSLGSAWFIGRVVGAYDHLFCEKASHC